jgi:hypothetical protein
MKNKALAWGLGIAGVTLAVFVVYSLTKPAPVQNNPLLSSSDVSAIGNFFTSIFGKKTAERDTSVNYYDRPLGTAGIDYPLEESTYDGI